ncbi:MAG TPA: hypothetical protein VM511_02480 [Luteolibacter sp.]|nr:hypothetical protein [Luteolibacter sp.]
MIAASLSLAVFARAEAPASSAATDMVVATINGEPVSAGEYSLVMGRQAPRVYASLKAEKNLDDHFGYWSPDAGPDSPFAKLRGMVLQELVTIKVQQTMAKEKGLQNDISFAGFQEGFLKENNRRREALAAGTVIYGPKQHNEPAYYYILFGDLSFRLKRKVCQETAPHIPEEEIRKFYEEHKAALKNPAYDAVRDRIAEEIAGRNFERLLPSLYQSAKVEINEEVIRGLLPRHDVAPVDPAKPTPH